MSRTLAFLTATRGGALLHWSDWASYSYLFLGVFLMFFPVIWLVLSSFKTEADLQRYPPTFLPYQQQTITLEGHADPLPLFQITGGEHEGKILAQLRRVGLRAQMVDPAAPETRLTIDIADRAPVERFTLAT